MRAVDILAAAAAGIGSAWVLSHAPWFGERALVDRLAPYLPGTAGRRPAGLVSVRSVREVLHPVAASIGVAVSRVVRLTEPVERRLERVHRAGTAPDLRLRQVAWACLGLGAGLAAALVVGAAPAIAAGLVISATASGWLIPEQQTAAESDRWKKRTDQELPIVAEQLATLLGAGWSLTAALDRVAERGSGAVATDLGRVRRRVDAGVDEIAALREWADISGVGSVARLVSVLALNRETADLGRLLGEEARSIRRDAHRRLIESIERSSQQVWIPVTVATLVPGVILLAIPFVDALGTLTQQ